MNQALLSINLKYFLSIHYAQRDVMIFLLQHGYDSKKYIRLQELLERVRGLSGRGTKYNKSTMYTAVNELHKKGWIVFLRSSQLRASWIGYQEQLPPEFLRELRTSLAQASGFESWCDFVMRNEGAHRPSERTHTAEPPAMWQPKEIAATKTPGRYNGSDNSDLSTQVRGRFHRFDPQGFPLRAATHDTRK